jgi:hypothetical protein
MMDWNDSNPWPQPFGILRFQDPPPTAALGHQSARGLRPPDSLLACGSLSIPGAEHRGLAAERRILPLQGGLLATLAVRAAEQAIERRFSTLASGAGREAGEAART